MRIRGEYERRQGNCQQCVHNGLTLPQHVRRLDADGNLQKLHQPHRPVALRLEQQRVGQLRGSQAADQSDHGDGDR